MIWYCKKLYFPQNSFFSFFSPFNFLPYLQEYTGLDISDDVTIFSVLEKKKYDFFHRELMALSVQQRRLDMITITSRDNMNHPEKRKIVFITGGSAYVRVRVSWMTMNEWTNEWMNEWMKPVSWMKINGRMNEWMNISINQQINQSIMRMKKKCRCDKKKE